MAASTRRLALPSAGRSFRTSWASGSAPGPRHDGGYIDQNPALLGQPPANSIPRGQVTGELLPSIVGGQTGTNINKGETYSARVALLWKPIDAIAVEPSIYYQKRDQNSADLFDPTIGSPSDGRFISSRILTQPIYDTFYTPSLKLVFDVGWAQLTSFDQQPAPCGQPGLRLHALFFRWRSAVRRPRPRPTPSR